MCSNSCMRELAGRSWPRSLAGKTGCRSGQTGDAVAPVTLCYFIGQLALVTLTRKYGLRSCVSVLPCEPAAS